jgi:glycosyltransferase involved in cell wall biosynthesis
MKVIYVHHYYYPVIGGLERVIQNIAERLVKLDHEVHVITSMYGAEGRSKEEIINGVHVHRVKAWRMYSPDLILPRDLPKELLKSADIVHIFSQNSLFNVVIGDTAKELGRNVVSYFLAVDAFSDHPSIIVRPVGSLYGKSCTLKALHFTDRKLVMGFRDMYILRKKYKVKDEIHIIPDGVPKEYFTLPRNPSNEFRKRYSIIQKDFFLFIGRIHKLKGPHVIIKALRKIQGDVAGVFIGPDDGYLKECLKLALALGIRDKVYFLGYVNEQIKISAIDSAIAVISSSLCNYAEIVPISIWEAWARGKPVIASKVGDIPYRVKHGLSGLLFDQYNYNELAEHMKVLLENQELANSLGENGKKHVLTWEEIVAEIIRLYKNL